MVSVYDSDRLAILPHYPNLLVSARLALLIRQVLPVIPFQLLVDPQHPVHR